MKKNVFALIVTAFASICIMGSCSKNEGKGSEENLIGGHEYVEIGGLKWATMNVGAWTVAGNYMTCGGDYFAWSETEPRYSKMTRTGAEDATFAWENGCANGYDSNPIYEGTTLDAEHDAATAAWGEDWRTPTNEEFIALVKACTGSDDEEQKPMELINTIKKGGIYWLNETQTIEPAYTGVAGMLFVSASDITKRVFFPASGIVSRTTLRNNQYGCYWSSSNSEKYQHAYYLNFNSSCVHLYSKDDYAKAKTVRPVSD